MCMQVYGRSSICAYSDFKRIKSAENIQLTQPVHKRNLIDYSSECMDVPAYVHMHVLFDEDCPFRASRNNVYSCVGVYLKDRHTVCVYLIPKMPCVSWMELLHISMCIRASSMSHVCSLSMFLCFLCIFMHGTVSHAYRHTQV